MTGDASTSASTIHAMMPRGWAILCAGHELMISKSPGAWLYFNYRRLRNFPSSVLLMVKYGETFFTFTRRRRFGWPILRAI